MLSKNRRSKGPRRENRHSFPSRVPSLALSPSAEAEPGKGEGSYANARHPTPVHRNRRIKKPEARREAARREGGLGNRKRSEKAKLACFVYRIPPSRALRLSPRRFGPRRRWTSSSISSSARPGESCPSPCPRRRDSGAVGLDLGRAGKRVFWWGWMGGCRCLALALPAGVGSRAVGPAVGSDSRVARGPWVVLCPTARNSGSLS